MRSSVTTLVSPPSTVQLFGHSSLTSGKGIMSGLLINPVFVSRFYSAYGGADGSTEAVNQTIIGISVSCLQVRYVLTPIRKCAVEDLRH